MLGADEAERLSYAIGGSIESCSSCPGLATPMSGRIDPCSWESGADRMCTEIGNVHLKWALAEAGTLALRSQGAGHPDLRRPCGSRTQSERTRSSESFGDLTERSLMSRSSGWARLREMTDLMIL